MLLGQELKFKNKLCNLKLGTFFSALPGLGASALSGRVELTCETLIPLSSECSVKSVGLKNNNLWDFKIIICGTLKNNLWGDEFVKDSD